MNQFLHISYILLAVSFIVACSSTKPVAVVRQTDNKELLINQLYDSIYSANTSIHSLYSRFTAEFSNPKKILFKGSIKIKTDSTIWVSVSPALNIEAMRCMLTPDSIKFINRLNKTYYAGSYDILHSITGVPLNYFALQSVLLNSMIFYPFEDSIDTLETFLNYQILHKKNEITAQNLSQKERRQLSSKKNDSTFIFQSMNFMADNFKLSNFEIIDEAKNIKFLCSYSDFVTIDSITLPKKCTFDVKSQKKKMELKILYDKFEYNAPQSFPFSINSKYKKIE